MSANIFRSTRRFFKNYFSQQRALLYRNYKLFLVGQCLSNIGTWIQRMAMIWLAYTLTKSAFLLGLVGFCEQVPIFLIAPFAGVFADRWDKHKALIRIESLAMIQAVLLGIITFMHVVDIGHIIILSLCLGVINAFEVPIRQSFVVEMVNRDKAALPNAIAVNSTVFNMSRLIGPSVAGIMINVVGEGWCFMANALSYAIVTGSLLLMRIKSDRETIKDKGNVWEQLKEGVRYINAHKIMRSLLLLLAFISFCNASLRTLAPVFAKDILKGNANTLGWLLSSAGIGAITGALLLTERRKPSVMRQIVSFTGFLLGSAMIAFAFSHSLFLSSIFMAFGGLAQMMHTACTNTLLQEYVADDMRGRVMSFYTVCLQGTMPFGSLVSGSIAQVSSGVWAMVSMGVICIVATLIFRDHRQGNLKSDTQKLKV
ncbi:MAG: MFS transporter [Arachidicoccus sp.]|nr:MFS transporter [Arachidicoccus sp.]